MLDSLAELVSSSPLAYLIVFALVAGDALLPLVPGESALLAAAALAADAELVIWAVWSAGFLGAIAGDLAAS